MALDLGSGASGGTRSTIGELPQHRFVSRAGHPADLAWGDMFPLAKHPFMLREVGNASAERTSLTEAQTAVGDLAFHEVDHVRGDAHLSYVENGDTISHEITE